MEIKDCILVLGETEWQLFDENNTNVTDLVKQKLSSGTKEAMLAIRTFRCSANSKYYKLFQYEIDKHALMLLKRFYNDLGRGSDIKISYESLLTQLNYPYNESFTLRFEEHLEREFKKILDGFELEEKPRNIENYDVFSLDKNLIAKSAIERIESKRTREEIAEMTKARLLIEELEEKIKNSEYNVDREYLWLGFSPIIENKVSDLSKVLGYPLLSKKYPYPKDSNGDNMFHFVQLNLSQFKNLDKLKLPQRGLLNFFISNDYTEHFVLFNEEIAVGDLYSQSDIDELQDAYKKPQSECYGIYSADVLFEQPLDVYTYEYGALIYKELSAHIKDREELRSQFSRALGNDAFAYYLDITSKVGGYIDLIDREEYVEKDEFPFEDKYCVLLKIEFDEEFAPKLFDGEEGHITFVIKEADLLKKDFSKVKMIVEQV